MDDRTAADLRAWPRFDVAQPVAVQDVQGTTANISNQGVYFVSPVPHDVGSLINVTIEYTQGGERHRISCEGKVLRAVPSGHGTAVAARFLTPFFA